MLNNIFGKILKLDVLKALLIQVLFSSIGTAILFIIFGASVAQKLSGGIKAVNSSMVITIAGACITAYLLLAFIFAGYLGTVKDAIEGNGASFKSYLLNMKKYGLRFLGIILISLIGLSIYLYLVKMLGKVVFGATGSMVLLGIISGTLVAIGITSVVIGVLCYALKLNFKKVLISSILLTVLVLIFDVLILKCMPVSILKYIPISMFMIKAILCYIVQTVYMLIILSVGIDGTASEVSLNIIKNFGYSYNDYAPFNHKEMNKNYKTPDYHNLVKKNQDESQSLLK